MNKFLYIDSQNILYDSGFNVVNRNGRNTYELLNEYGFKKDDVVFDNKSVGMRFIGAIASSEDATVLIKVPKDNYTNFHFKEKVRAIYSEDNNVWLKFYDRTTYNEAIKNVSISEMVGSEMSIVEKNKYELLKDMVSTVKSLTTVNNINFNYIFLRLEKGKEINAVYESLMPTSSYLIKIKPEVSINKDMITISGLKKTDILRVNLTKSNDEIKNTLKEFLV